MNAPRLKSPAAWLLAYLWASPVTLLGLLLAGVLIATRGRSSRLGGVLEVHGGWAARFGASAVPLAGGAEAITLGHVIVGRSAASLDRWRAHERVHVRQCERWGPLFLPA